MTNDQRSKTNDPSSPDHLPVRRMKTYTGGQGYVYQYYFVGKRPAADSSTEFIFDVTADRKTTFSVSVFLPNDAVQGWNRSHGRSLTDAEEYAAVKMRLFRAFDEVEDMMRQGRSLQLDAASTEELLQTLGVT